MEEKYVLKYNLKRSEKVKTLPTETSAKLSSYFKLEATFVSDLLFQRLVVFANSCNISFDDCKRHELRVYPSALFGSTI